MTDPRSDVPSPAPTRLVDIDMPFGRLVLFFFKAGLAMIPALILVWAVAAAIFFLIGSLFGVGFMEHGRMMRW
jgi:hypothetical protein